MPFLHYHIFSEWFYLLESYAPAVAVTAGAALLFACAIGAVCSPCEEKDEFFHRQAL